MQPAPHATTVAERPERGRLLRILGIGFGLAVIIGNTIGAGILRTPGEVAARLPEVGLFLGVWVAGGGYALLGAISIAELGTMLPRSGGQYIFARYALGDYAGFVVGWSDWISTCGSSAAISIVIGEYLGVLFPGLARYSVSIALGIVIAFAVLQWRGLRWGSNIQNVTSLLKALAFVALVAACFLLGGKSPSGESTPPGPPAGSPGLIAVVLSLQAVIYTYDGWTGVIYFSEEVRNPGRDIPRAMLSGVLAIIAIYLLVNLAVLYVLPISQIGGSDLAVGAAAQAIFGAHGDTIIRALTVVSLLSAVNACQMMATRVLFAMSRDRLFTQRAATVNPGGTPTLTLLVTTLVAVLFILGGAFENSRRIFENIIAVVAFFFVANYAISFISLFVLRRREPARERPYRAWGYPWTTGLALAGSIAFMGGAIASDRKNSVYALIGLGASYPVFLWLQRLRRRDAKNTPA